MTRNKVDYEKRYRDRATEMRALAEIMTHPKTRAKMLSLAHDYDDLADLERTAHVTSGPNPTPKTGDEESVVPVGSF
jgi:hypothetical protein